MAHPAKSSDHFLTQLGKLAAAIFVGWNSLMLAMAWPLLLFMPLIMLAAGSEDPAALPSPKLGNLEYVWGDAASPNKLLVIPVNGMIIGDTDANGVATALNGAVDGNAVKAKLREAADQDDIAGIMLEINSPGGTIYGARAIADGVKYYRERTKQPVYAHIQGVGASGAYWAASSTDQIIADYGSDIGSIGVIMGPFKYYDTVISEDSGILGGGVVTQNGIQTVTLTAGRSKDIGNPYRRLTADEIKQLQQSVNNEYDNFVSFVSDHRKIPADKIRTTIGAMIYDNKTAQSLGLIDGSGSQEEAYVKLARAANLNDYQVMREVTPSGLISSLLSAVTHAAKPTAQTPFDPCNLTHVSLAYYGDTVSLCQK